MSLSQIPLFCDLDPDEQSAWQARATTRTLRAGEVLFYEGDPAETLYALAAGEGRSTGGGSAAPGPAWAEGLLDPLASLGGLPHRVKFEAVSDCTLWAWPVADLWQSPALSAAARRVLASALGTVQTRLDELEAPVHFAGETAQLVPGPFMFENVTLIFAFCEGDLDGVRARLREGLSLVRRPGRKRDALLLALARFPDAYPEADPGARFGYTETTVFVPVRYGRGVGLFVPYIYPSTYEPILLGREIYGFPKRLGQTTFGPHEAALSVAGVPQFCVRWSVSEGSDETRLVRALIDWLGIEGRLGALAFQAGEVLRRTMRLPPFRRVGVYNHKRILAPDAAPGSPAYAVDQLTHALFGVLRWYQIARISDPALDVRAGPLAGMHLTLREAYRTQLDLRLSTGRVLRDYRAEKTE